MILEMKARNKIYGLFAILFVVALACNAPAGSPQSTEPVVEAATEAPVAESAPSSETEEPADVEVVHMQLPSVDVASGKVVYDAESSGTASDKRAPYGDSYDVNLLERPFLQDMTYVPDLDISSFSLAKDETWFYVSVKLIGFDPNNSPGINYAVELDADKDGFGDFIIWAQPPYTMEWTASNVQVFADKNRNTSGLSSTKSDAPISTDGYETLIFDGSQGIGDDPDLAWIRMVNSADVTLQFAFKRSLAGDVFMFGVLADAGIKDVTKLDYVDRFTEEQAGSSVRDRAAYPLDELFSVDNTCRQAQGFEPTGYEPMGCPVNIPPTAKPNQSQQPTQPSGEGCMIQPSECTADAPHYWPAPHCACSSQPYQP
jgi:hypothetical protein